MSYKIGDDMFTIYGGRDNGDRAMIIAKKTTKKGATKYRLRKVNQQDLHKTKPRLTKHKIWHDEGHLDRNWKRIGSMKP